VVGTALLLTAYALIALGIGTILRHSGGAIATGVAIIFLPVLMLGVFPEHIRTRLEQFTPLAGMAVQSTTDRMLSTFDGGDTRGMPIGHWTDSESPSPGRSCSWAWATPVCEHATPDARRGSVSLKWRSIAFLPGLDASGLLASNDGGARASSHP
jgi:hypothetical protein